MYEQFFGLTEKPFSIQPDPSFLYWGRTHRLAYAMLEYGVLNHAGISVITGEVGCGKTTLIHRLLDQLSSTHTVALISNIQEGRGDLLSWVLMGFGQSFSGKSHVELFSELQAFFIAEYAKGKRIVLIIDEAQNLSLDMLEELRLLSNINAGKDQLLQLILVGQPQLKGLLNRPELLQLAQRVGSDFHLTPLSKEEVHIYIETRLSIAGCTNRIFTDRAIDLIAEQSRGVPRIINVIADTALVYAFSAGEQVVSVEVIRSVVRDKQDYGVFGIASDEQTAPPISPRTDGGPEAFEGDRNAISKPSGAALDKPSGASGKPKPSKSSVSDPAPAPVAQRQDKPSQPAAPAVKRAQPSTQQQTVKETPAPAAAPVRAATKPSKTNHTEETADTGVIVLGVPGVSPEAAIRSAGDGRAIVYVPTGADRDTHVVARSAGAVVVETGEKVFSTLGRARNAGYRQLKKIAPHIRFAQFLDADKVLDPDWIVAAQKFLDRRPEVSILEGGLNWSNDDVSKNVNGASGVGQVGEITVNSQPSLFVRTDVFEAVGGFRGDLTTCETQDLCIRQRRRGAHLWRLDAPMLLAKKPKDTPATWWREQKIKGFENAFNASLHGGPPERLGVKDSILAVFWGGVFPLGVIFLTVLAYFLTTVIAPFLNPFVVSAQVLLVGIVVYGVRILIAALQPQLNETSRWKAAVARTFSCFPNLSGAVRFWFGAKSPQKR